MATPLEELISLFPQTALPIEEGCSQSKAYQDIVRRGIFPDHPENPFRQSPEDRLYIKETPVGPVRIVHPHERQDFVRLVQVFSHKCEPHGVPDSMGAVIYFGLVNWNKIRSHKLSYLLGGHKDWGEEFKRFTADPQNYKENLIMVSSGPYSALPASHTGMGQEDWIRCSLEIRTLHELTHLVSRTLYPENQQALRDELVADCIGLYGAMKTYDRALAADLLGITPQGYHPGGRLQNYLHPGDSLEEAVEKCSRALDLLSDQCRKTPDLEPFRLLEIIETEKLGLDLFQ